MIWMVGCGLAGLVLVFALIAAGVYLGSRLSPLGGDRDSGRALLDRRLAAGEIDVDEYYEREAVLREPKRRRR